MSFDLDSQSLPQFLLNPYFFYKASRKRCKVFGEKENPFHRDFSTSGIPNLSIHSCQEESQCLSRFPLLGSNKRLSHAKGKPPFLGELPTQLSFGSTPGKASSTYSQQEASGAETGSQLRKGQARTFLDRDQGVSTAPVAHTVRLRFYYQ